MQGILGVQREADRQAMERDAMNMRGGVLRQDPGLMQRIGGAVADYAVPDRYSNALNPSVMSPRLQLDPNASMQDMPDMTPMLMDMMPQAGIGGVIKRARGNVGDAVKSLPLRGGKFIGAPHDLKITPQKMPWVVGNFEQMAKEGEKAWPWYTSGGEAFNDWFQPSQRRQAIDTFAAMSPQAPVSLNTKFGTKAMNQYGLGQDVNAGMVPSQARGMLSPLWKGAESDLWNTVKDASKVPSFSVNLRQGAGFPLNEEDMLRSTQDRWMLRAGNFKGDMSPNTYKYLSAITQDVAGTLGIHPNEAQAGVWTSLKARWESVAPPIQKKYVKKGMMRKSKIVNPKTGQREAIGPYEIKPEHARKYNDEVFNKAMKADIPDDAFDEAGRSFDYFFDQISKKYDSHSMDELSPFMNDHGRVAPWDAQGIPHRIKDGKVDLLMPEFEKVLDPSSSKQAQIAEAMIRDLRGESGNWGAKVNELGGGAGYDRFKSGKTILSPY